MFKRAVVTDEISQDFDLAISIAKSYQLDGVELRSAWEKNPHELTATEINHLKVKVAENQLQVPCLAAPLFKCRLHSVTEYREHLQILERTIQVAHALGSKLIRGFTFWDEGDFNANLPRIIAKITSIEPILRQNDITLVIESDPATSANSSQKLGMVLANINSDFIKALWDPGNNLYVADAERPFPEGYQRLKPHIAHIHVKDIQLDPTTGKADGCALGHGIVGFQEIFETLAHHQYRGWLSLETHYRIHNKISEELLALPKGSAFSLGGEAATRQCLDNWHTMFRL